MKKRLSVLLAVLLLLSCMLMAVPTAQAEKATEKRAIAVVFDNSGSMYMSKNLAWCRATYAMEVFASMLNEGDILQIYPMNPCTIGENGAEVYSMENPLVITNAADSSIIRKNFIPTNGGTPVKSIDAAAAGLKKVSGVKAENKYLIILTDGHRFHIEGKEKEESPEDTKILLDSKIQEYAGNGMTVMYIGMDTDGSSTKACNPDTPESEYYVERIAEKSVEVISSLTELCNIIFGRDTLPSNHIKNSGKTIELDVSTKKLIAFVQGTNIENLKITGSGIGNMVGSPQQVKYSEKGTAFTECAVDTNLQGMMVTYDGSTAGSFNVEFSGTASSIEVYYEPDVELAFIFTDSEGNPVDPNALYEGDYKVSFGMMDAKTGKLVSSDLLGKPSYKGSYTLNGEKKKFDHTGFSGSVDIPLKKGDTFEADLEVEYLSGYRIYKSSKDFGWPEGGITVAPKPIAGYKLEITGGDSSYPLQQLEEGKPYKAVVYFENQPLTGEELSKVELWWEPEKSNAELKKEFMEDHWEIKLYHKDPNAPQNTKCGECTVLITATYTPKGSDEAVTSTNLTYNIKDDFATLGAELIVPQDYIVIKDMADTQAMTVKLTLNGAFLTPEEFKAVKVSVDCGGINYELTPDEANSAYKIKILETDKISEGDYIISVNAQYTDSIGRVAKAETEYLVTLSSLPLWVKWAITLSILLILFIIIWTILHIRVLPTKAHTTKKLSFMTYDSEDVTRSANFLAEIKQGSAKFQTQFAGRKYGLTMDASPGKESYLYKGQKSRSAEISVASVRKFGPAKIQEAMIGSAKYVLDEDTGKLVPALPNMKPFLIKNGMMVKFSGSVQDAGVDKDFEVTSKINFKK